MLKFYHIIITIIIIIIIIFFFYKIFLGINCNVIMYLGIFSSQVSFNVQSRVQSLERETERESERVSERERASEAGRQAGRDTSNEQCRLGLLSFQNPFISSISLVSISCPIFFLSTASIKLDQFFFLGQEFLVKLWSLYLVFIF